MTIGDVARAAGVGVETIRFYERRGLIEWPPTLEPYPGTDTSSSAVMERPPERIAFLLRLNPEVVEAELRNPTVPWPSTVNTTGEYPRDPSRCNVKDPHI